MEATQERGTYGSRIENRVRLTIEVEADFRRDLKLAATRRGMTMREYVTDILERGHAEALEESK